jgi:hypothetical protein
MRLPNEVARVHETADPFFLIKAGHSQNEKGPLIFRKSERGQYQKRHGNEAASSYNYPMEMHN